MDLLQAEEVGHLLAQGPDRAYGGRGGPFVRGLLMSPPMVDGAFARWLASRAGQLLIETS